MGVRSPVVDGTPGTHDAPPRPDADTACESAGVPSAEPVAEHSFRDRVRGFGRIGSRHRNRQPARKPLPGSAPLRILTAFLLSSLCLLSVGGAILLLLLWQQDRDAGVLANQLERTWDYFDVLRRAESYVALALVPVSMLWLALAATNVRRATANRRNPIVAAASLPIGVFGAWYVGREIVTVADTALGQAAGVVLQAVALAIPLLALLRIAQACEARNLAIRLAFVTGVSYVACIHFLAGLSTVDPASPPSDWGRLAGYMIIAALVQVLGALSVSEAMRAIDEGTQHRYELRSRFSETLLAQLDDG